MERSLSKTLGVAGLLYASLVAGCHGSDGRSVGTFPTTSFTGTGGATESDSDANTTGEPTDMLDVPAEVPDVGSGEACETLVEHAEVQPQLQDILLFVDNSTSMGEETGFVQESLNAFSAQISEANVDARILLFSSYPGNGLGICIDPPLGSGGCPKADENPPDFIHIDHILESAVFNYLVDLYPEYSPHLREGAATHIVAVTDFDANFPVQEFIANFNAVAPQLADFVFHGIIATEDPDTACVNGTSCCGVADQQCVQFQEIIALTGGVEGNLCDQEFQPIFDALAQQVIGDAELPCMYDLPVDEAGAAFDKDKVNVEFDDGAGGTLELGRVDGPGSCAAVQDGWYYDDPDQPTVVHVCPQTCDAIQGFELASISVIFGCETIPAS